MSNLTAKNDNKSRINMDNLSFLCVPLFFSIKDKITQWGNNFILWWNIYTEPNLWQRKFSLGYGGCWIRSDKICPTKSSIQLLPFIFLLFSLLYFFLFPLGRLCPSLILFYIPCLFMSFFFFTSSVALSSEVPNFPFPRLFTN